MTAAASPRWGSRRTLRTGTARLPEAAAPDLDGRSHRVTAHVRCAAPPEGVLLAQGDGQAGFSFFVAGERLVHLYRHLGTCTVTEAQLPSMTGHHRWSVVVAREGRGAHVSLLAEDALIGEGWIPVLSHARLAYTGMDVGCDRGQPVGPYRAPARFDGALDRIDVDLADDQELDDVLRHIVESATG